MRLRSKFLIFVITLHLILTVLAYALLAYSKFFFFGIQLLVIVSAIISYRLYRYFVRPMEILASGVESIHNRDFSCTIMKTGHYELDRLVDVYNQMIEQLRRERLSQQEQQYFLERLINAASIGVIILDLDANISMLNPAAENILGYASNDIFGKPLSEIVKEPFKNICTMKPGKSLIVKVNGIQVYRCHKSLFLDHGFHRQFYLIEELTEEIIETQKKAYEKVIRSMSHEVNNSVGAINSILNSILNDYPLPANDGQSDYHDAISVAIERNSHLSKFMANYADVVRIPPPHKVIYDIHNLLKSIYALMEKNCLDRKIEWRFELSPGTMEVEMDIGQIEQVMINIFKNAIDAIGSGGIITVRTSADPATLRIIDTGKGIDIETSSNLFTPFYTTKKDGQGIGLTLIREILMNHGFAFSLNTNKDNNTEFKIIFK